MRHDQPEPSSLYFSPNSSLKANLLIFVDVSRLHYHLDKFLLSKMPFSRALNVIVS
jgi:hypothetical protein